MPFSRPAINAAKLPMLPLNVPTHQLYVAVTLLYLHTPLLRDNTVVCPDILLELEKKNPTHITH